MVQTRMVWLLVGVLLCPLMVQAGDVISMPTGNAVQPRHLEFNYIYWDLEGSRVPLNGGTNGELTEARNSTESRTVGDYANIYELFVGATEKLELDILHADLQGVDNFTEVNAYYTVQEETAEDPSLIVGVTNLFGSDWLGSEDRPEGDDRLSPFVLGAYNLRAPEAGPPTPEEPLVRAHLGLGFNYHEDKLFGAVQFLVTPEWGGGIFNYRGDPAYLAVYKPQPEWEFRAGWFGGDPLISGGYFYSW